MKPFRTEAIILRRTNYGEADRIISLVTPERGKVSAIAKGVRRPKSKLAGGLELLAVCDLTLVEGRGDMAVVTSARLQHFYGKILHDYARMELAYLCIKEINRATETVSEADFYYLLRDTLIFLEALSIPSDTIELWFRLRLRLLLGHALNLITDREGKKLAADANYHFDFTEQAFYRHERGTFGADHIKVLRLASANDPAALRQVGGLQKVIEPCLWLLRSMES